MIYFYRRYVDDVFAAFDNANEATKFRDYLNSKHPNIQFTDEPEVNNVLSFLDVTIHNENSVTTSVYRKKTYTGLLTNYFSYTSDTYKLGLIRNLLFRAYHINSSWQGYQEEVKRIYFILQKNSFPKHIIDRITTSFLNNVQKPSNIDDNSTDETKKSRYYKLPYRGKYSKMLQSKLNQIIKNLCKSTDIKLVFVPFKVGQYFSAKDKVPSKYHSHVIYKFTCSSCNAVYIGETARHLETRVNEHLKTDKQSAIYKHLQSSADCKQHNNFSSFVILDRGQSKYNLKIKEGLHILWEKPSLNKQVKCVKISIAV